MIGVDTNVLLRLYVADDAEQHKVAAKFFSERTEVSPAFIPVVVIVEFYWVLTKVYRYPTQQVLLLLDGLVNSRDVVLERQTVFERALAKSVDGHADLTDAIIAETSAAERCTTTVTFDRKAAKRLPSMELLQ